MADLISELGRVLRYARERIRASDIHPELRFTRLGAVLREHATEPGDVGELAHQALTSPHDQPLELMPLHLLRDKMQENPEHTLAGKFDWPVLPERVARQATLRELVNSHNASQQHPAGRVYPYEFELFPVEYHKPANVNPWTYPREGHFRSIHEKWSSAHPDASPTDFQYSYRELMAQDATRQGAEHGSPPDAAHDELAGRS